MTRLSPSRSRWNSVTSMMWTDAFMIAVLSTVAGVRPSGHSLSCGDYHATGASSVQFRVDCLADLAVRWRVRRLLPRLGSWRRACRCYVHRCGRSVLRPPVRLRVSHPPARACKVAPRREIVSGAFAAARSRRAYSSAGERCLHTAEVHGSNPCTPTALPAGRPPAHLAAWLPGLGWLTGTTTQRRRAQQERDHSGAGDYSDVPPEKAARIACQSAHHGVVHVAQGEDVGDYFQDAGKLVPRRKESAENELRKEQRGHELDRLELRAREGADEKSERHAEECGENRQGGKCRRVTVGVYVEKSDADCHGNDGLHDRNGTECKCVPGKNVDFRDGKCHEPFEGSGPALTEHRDGRDDEHDDEWENPEQRRADASKNGWMCVVHVPKQGEDSWWHEEYQGKCPVVAPQLVDHPNRRGHCRRRVWTFAAPGGAEPTADAGKASVVPGFRFRRRTCSGG